MDKKILNEEELAVLKKFIASRGFKDAGTVNEILDHLACKVEEIMSASPSLSLEEATARAHSSFGIRGFRGIAESYEAQLRQRYRAVYWREVRATIKHPLHLVALVAAGALSFKSYTWMAGNEQFNFLDLTIFSWAVFLLVMALDVVLLLSVRERRRGNLILQIALAPNNFYCAPYIATMFMHSSDGMSNTGVIVNACMHAFIVIFGILNFKARLKALETAKKDYELSVQKFA